MPTIKLANAYVPASLDLVEINGAKVSGAALVGLLSAITRPNPKRWYRFERQGDAIVVTAREDVAE